MTGGISRFAHRSAAVAAPSSSEAGQGAPLNKQMHQPSHINDFDFGDHGFGLEDQQNTGGFFIGGGGDSDSYSDFVVGDTEDKDSFGTVGLNFEETDTAIGKEKKPMSANLQKSIGSQGIPIFAIRSAAPVPLESMQTPHAHQQTVASKTSNAPLPSAITPSPGIGSHADVNNPSTNANSVSAFLHKNLDNHDIPPASSSPTRMKTFLPNNIRVPASASVQQQGLSKKVSQIPISSSTTTEESVFLTEEDSFKESAKHVPSLTHCGPIASTTPSTTSQILQIPSTVTPTMCLDQNNDKDDFTRAHDDCMRNIRDFNDLKGNYEEKLLEATVSLDQAMAAMLKVQADKIDLSDAMNAMKSTLDAMLRDICDN